MHISQKIQHNIKKESATDTITLDYEARFLRRKRLISDSGEAFLVELQEVQTVSETDGFVLDDGRIIAIYPKSEPIMKITSSNLARIAWHIGNRHTPCQIQQDHLFIQQDHVIEDMLIVLGAKIEKLEAAFMPERGAYGHGRTHSHHGTPLETKYSDPNHQY